jgi:hypothetical protein
VKEGEKMDSNFYSERAEQIAMSEEYRKVPRMLENGELIQFIEEDGRINVVIVISENATTKSLQKTIPVAINWKNIMLSEQGYWIKGGEKGYYESLLRMHEVGISYSKIAKKVNTGLAEDLKTLFEFDKKYRQLSPKTIQEFLDSELINELGSYDRFIEDLKMWSYSEREAKKLVDAAFINIKKNFPPFEKDYPVSTNKVRGKLRRWKNKKWKLSLRKKVRGG